MRRRLRAFWPALAILIGLITGAAFTVQAVRSADEAMRMQWLTEARLMTRALDWAAVATLHADPAIAAMPGYALVKHQIRWRA